jgi:DnaJ-class molecular chaperone
MSAGTEAIAAKRARPAGICPRCHTVIRAFDLIGKKCAKPLPFGAKCPGVIRSALAADEWTECPDCGASGRVGESVCVRCQGEGWLYDRSHLPVAG